MSMISSAASLSTELQSVSMEQSKADGLAHSLGKVTPEQLKDVKKIQKAAEEFESVFLELVLKSMRNTVQKSGFIDGGNGEDIYRSMLDSEYAKQMSQMGSIGLSSQIAEQLLRAQGIDMRVQAPATAAQNRKIGISSYARSALPETPAAHDVELLQGKIRATMK